MGDNACWALPAGIVTHKGCLGGGCRKKPTPGLTQVVDLIPWLASPGYDSSLTRFGRRMREVPHLLICRERGVSPRPYCKRAWVGI